MNKDWNKARQKYNFEAGNLSSFNGSEVKERFAGQRKSQFAGETMSRADGANVFTPINDSDKTLTVVITNTLTSGGDVTAIVFGAYTYSGETQPNAGVTVTIEESSHTQVRSQSISQPFWVNGLRYLVSDTSLLSNTVFIVYNNPSGDDTTKKFRPLSYKTASQLTTTQVDAPNYTFGVDGSAQMQIAVGPGEQVIMTLNIGGRYDASQLVDGKSPVMVANQAPLATGLVTVVQGGN